MTYGDLKAQFQALLNRSDCSDSLADTFFTQGLQRIQRELRLPHNERVLTIDTSAGDVSTITVPSDWMETKTFLGPYGEIRFFDAASWAAIGVNFLDNSIYISGIDQRPFAYTRIGNTFYVKGVIPFGSVAQLIYWGPESGFASDTDSTTLSTIAPDVIIYAAMTYALDYFTDDRAPAYETKFTELGTALQDQATEGEDRNGGAVSPAYDLDDGVM